MSQRGGLNLSPDGRYFTCPLQAIRMAARGGWFSSIRYLLSWQVLMRAHPIQPTRLPTGECGPLQVRRSIPTGFVYATTGNGTTRSETTPGYWAPICPAVGARISANAYRDLYPFQLLRHGSSDTDLAGGGPVVVPDLGSANTSTPHLLAFGGKQGNMYLLDRDHMPGKLTGRQACADPTTQCSLRPISLCCLLETSRSYGAPGPLNIFGPYSETNADTEYAKSRSTPAYFQAADGTTYLFVTGSTKASASSQTTVPPCVVRLKIVKATGKPAYLAMDAVQNSVTMLSPGSAMITSNGSSNAIIWVLDGNVLRLQNLVTPPSHPILYAFDQNLNILCNSTQTQLNGGGKYMSPVFARGIVFVGDRPRASLRIVIAGGSSSEVAINSGGGVAGIFSADMDFNGGHADAYTNPIDVTGVVNPAPQAVYQTKRTGMNGVGFTYVIPQLKAGGSYNVRLHFAESAATGIGQRLFNVAINGTTVLSNFDVFATAGAAFKAVIKEFITTADGNGNISIAYNYGSATNPLANGIEVIPIANGVSINSGGSAAGNFLADTDVVGGHADTFTGCDGYQCCCQSSATGSLSIQAHGKRGRPGLHLHHPEPDSRPRLHNPFAFR